MTERLYDFKILDKEEVKRNVTPSARIYRKAILAQARFVAVMSGHRGGIKDGERFAAELLCTPHRVMQHGRCKRYLRNVAVWS